MSDEELWEDIRDLYKPLWKDEKNFRFEANLDRREREAEREFEENYLDEVTQYLLLRIEPREERVGFQASTDLLILLVGNSLEPLKLIVAIHRPCYLAMVYTEGSSKNFEAIERFAMQKEWGTGSTQKLSLEVKSSDPAEVFNRMSKKWENEWSKVLEKDARVAVDITGGKKTMVVGAFQFAAAQQPGQDKLFPLYYLDLEKTDPETNRPDLETSRYRRITNPVEIYLLDEIKELRELFKHRDYKAAHNLVERVYKNTVNAESLKAYYEPERRAMWEQRRDYISGLDKWNRQANYIEAYQDLQKLAGWQIPYAIQTLGKRGANLDLRTIPTRAEPDKGEAYLVHLIDEFHRAIFLALHEREDTRAFIEAARLLELSARLYLLISFKSVIRYLTKSDQDKINRAGFTEQEKGTLEREGFIQRHQARFIQAGFSQQEFDDLINPQLSGAELKELEKVDWVNIDRVIERGQGRIYLRNSGKSLLVELDEALLTQNHFRLVSCVRDNRNSFIHRTIRASWNNTPNPDHLTNQSEPCTEIPGTRSALRLAHQRLLALCQIIADFQKFESHLDIGFSLLDADEAAYLRGMDGNFEEFCQGLSREARAYYPPTELDEAKAGGAN